MTARRIPARPHAQKPRQRGQITLIAAVLMIGLVGAAGLGIDGGMAYMTKARLNAAVDSAAVAAARAVTNGTTQSEQTAAARQAATDFFNANFPAGYLRGTPKLNTPSVTFDQGKVTIAVSATATMPLSLMKVLGFQNVAVAATSTTIRKDLDMVFVIDSSGSMKDVWSTVRSNANSFLNQFSPSTDRVGLVHFSSGAVSDVAIRTTTRGFDRPAMQTKITNLSNGGYTNYAEGMWQARSQLNSITSTNRSSLRVIVFFSDGNPNTIAAAYKTVGGTNCTGGIMSEGIKNNDDVNGYFAFDKQDSEVNSSCDDGTLTSNELPKQIPQYYNAHDPADTEFLMVGSQPKTVTAAADSKSIAQNIFNASYNVPLAMASSLRTQGVYIFTLGLGGNGSLDADLLKRMANTADATGYNKNQPTGIYCYAATINDLRPCFSKLASEILRISQ
ncbi:VWA domain-containing protein [Cupriavidus pauculus]|uniref:vWA domain-containing protein n=1 Tax=Cupriavidus pauculus TaxID=82633 RepID=UPI001EE39C65|nr:vWA domain-containing protein [Cupriavidus pauculus]GJG93709.1 VWA domain-containing protein [Cupriavidus pauculus]